MLLFIPKYLNYRILVGASPPILSTSLLTYYHSSLAHVSTPLPHEPKNGTCEGQPPRVESHQILKQSLHKSALKKKLRHDEDKLLHNDVFKNIGAYTSMPCEQCLRAAYFRYDLLGFLS